MDNNAMPCMATEVQINKINEFVNSPVFKIPLAGFLKNITGGLASSIDELTTAQAKDVINVMSKFTKKK